MPEVASRFDRLLLVLLAISLLVNVVVVWWFGVNCTCGRGIMLSEL